MTQRFRLAKLPTRQWRQLDLHDAQRELSYLQPLGGGDKKNPVRQLHIFTKELFAEYIAIQGDPNGVRFWGRRFTHEEWTEGVFMIRPMPEGTLLILDPDNLKRMNEATETPRIAQIHVVRDWEHEPFDAALFRGEDSSPAKEVREDKKGW